MRDVIILGGGVAGLTAGIYCMRAGLDTVMYEMYAAGGQAAITDEIENYPGFPEPVSGPELTSLMEKQATRLGLTIEYDEVIGLTPLGDCHECAFASGKIERTKTVIIATGASPRKTGLESEKRLAGRGVSYCATCDGFFFKGKSVAVIGGGDTAVSDAIYLSQLCSKVYLIHRRDSLRAAKTLQDKLFLLDNVEVVWDSVPDEITGTDKVSGVIVENKLTTQKKQIPCDGVFVAIGVVPNSNVFKDVVACDSGGFIITDENMETSVKGIFAAGDIRRKPLLQIVTAAADGAIAATSAAAF